MLIHLLSFTLLLPPGHLNGRVVAVFHLLLLLLYRLPPCNVCQSGCVVVALSSLVANYTTGPLITTECAPIGDSDFSDDHDMTTLVLHAALLLCGCRRRPLWVN